MLSSKKAGAMEELVKHRANGSYFEDSIDDEFAGYMMGSTSLAVAERMSMSVSSSQILDEVCSTNAFGVDLRDALADKRFQGLL